MPKVTLPAEQLHAGYVAIKRLQGEGAPVKASGTFKLKLARLAAALRREAETIEETVVGIAERNGKDPAAMKREQDEVLTATVEVDVPALITESELAALPDVPGSLEHVLPFVQADGGGA